MSTAVRSVHHGRPARPPGGIAMIESLIAILLLSMCALAYAALQMRGLQSNSSAMWRSKATLLAYDMADRMRANRSGVTAGAFNSLTSPGAAPGCGSGSACSPTTMAQLDYVNWSTTLAAELPGGSGVVCLDASPDDGAAGTPGCDGSGTMYAVKVFWSERGEVSRLVVPVRP